MKVRSSLDLRFYLEEKNIKRLLIGIEPVMSWITFLISIYGLKIEAIFPYLCYLLSPLNWSAQILQSLNLLQILASNMNKATQFFLLKQCNLTVWFKKDFTSPLSFEECFQQLNGSMRSSFYLCTALV